MTLGLEVIKFMLEQDPDNVPIVQRWIDKWFWRGYRVLTLVAMMMDYMLPKRVMSWKEAWEIYFEQNGGALFKDLARYGIKMPKGWEQIASRQGPPVAPGLERPSTTTAPRPFHTWMPGRGGHGLAVGQVPEHLRQVLPPALRALARRGRQEGNRFYNKTLPMLCQTCQIPMIFTEPGDPTKICYREATTRARSTTSAPTAARDLRARAREVRPGLAAGAPDLPGQLLPRGTDPTVRASTRWPRC
jgi:phenol hydroxylase P3 protein